MLFPISVEPYYYKKYYQKRISHPLLVSNFGHKMQNVIGNRIQQWFDISVPLRDISVVVKFLYRIVLHITNNASSIPYHSPDTASPLTPHHSPIMPPSFPHHSSSSLIILHHSLIITSSFLIIPPSSLIILRSFPRHRVTANGSLSIPQSFPGHRTTANGSLIILQAPHTHITNKH